MFPECAFIGYKFKDKEDIDPYLEVAGEGETFEKLKEWALKFNCWIFAGYAERDGDNLYNS